MSRYSDSPNDWFADDLPYETELRFSHGTQCNKKGESSDYRGRLFVRRGSDGYAWYCHNCGAAGIKKSSASERIRGRLSRSSGETSSSPSGGDREDVSFSPLDAQGKSWLNKYRLTLEETESNISGMFQRKDSDSRRVVLTIKDHNGNIRGYQYRDVSCPPGQPKYITEFGSDSREFAWHRHGRNDRTPSITIVEDIISGIKVSRTMDAVSLLGSPARIPQTLVEQIVELGYKNVRIWLDPDKRKTAVNYMRHLQSVYGLSTQVMISDADPKDEI